MNELDGLSVPELPPERVERIRRRGRAVLADGERGEVRTLEVLTVTVFSVAMLLWAVVSVLVPAA